MTWELVAIGLLILFIAGVAFMARRTKPPQIFNTYTTGAEPIDVEEVAEKVAKAVAREMAAELRDLLKDLKLGKGGRASKSEEEGFVEMDESIIPVAAKLEAQAVNLENLGKKEETVDKDLKKSQSKLKELLGKRK